MKKILFILLILFLTIGIVSAENNITEVKNPQSDLEKVTALESGDSNISFSDGYKGYCIEWGEYSAEKGDKFYINHDVDNNIKTFFVYFYPESQKDVVATQHMIWKFTDNKQFSRFNQTLYDQIIAKSATVQVPNDGVRIENNTKMIFSFKNLISPFEDFQNYFAYKISFDNFTCTINNNTTSVPQLLNNTTNISFNESLVIDEVFNNTTSTLSYEKIAIPSQHETGINITWLIGALIILIIIILLLY